MLVVGSTSVLGRAVAVLQRSAGHDVHFAGRRQADYPLEFPFENLPNWCAVERFDAVVNAVGSVGGLRTMEVSRAAIANTVAAVGALEIAQAVGAQHLVHLSSIYAADPVAYAGPASYPITKRSGDELLVTRAATSSISVSILRPTHVYDDGGACRPHQGALYGIVDRAVAGEPIRLTHPFGRRDYLHLDDLCVAVSAAVDSRPQGRFTVRSPETHTFDHIARTAIAFTGAGSVVTTAEPPHGEPPRAARLDVDPVLPGFRASVGLDEAIERIVTKART